MKPNHIFLFIFFTLVFTGCSKPETDLAGVYVSKDVTDTDAINIMYTRGYYDFINTATNEDTLVLNADKTFVYNKPASDDGLHKWYGKWSRDGGDIILNYDDEASAERRFTLNGDKLYRITDAKDLKRKKGCKNLCLMQKRG